MTKFNLIYSDDADNDLNDLFQVIAFGYKSPLTAYRYVQGIIDKINTLKRYPESNAIRTSPYYQQYGANTRRLNCKKMAIIYTIHADTVYVHRIVPSATITGL